MNEKVQYHIKINIREFSVFRFFIRSGDNYLNGLDSSLVLFIYPIQLKLSIVLGRINN